MSRMTEDEREIREVVQMYFEGVSRCDATILSEAWDAEVAHWKGIEHDESRLQFVRVEPVTESIVRWSQGTPVESKGEIVSVDVIDGQLAIVKFDFHLGDQNYLDVLTLYKLNDSWKLINKVFVSR